MIYERLADATMMASSFVKEGLLPTKAIEKVARKMDLNFNEIDRVTEALNTAQQISILRSNDRRKEFPVAEAAIVKANLSNDLDSIKSAEKQVGIARDYYAEYLREKYIPKIPLATSLPERSGTVNYNTIQKCISPLKKAASIGKTALPQLYEDMVKCILDIKPSEEYIKEAYSCYCHLPYAEKAASILSKKYYNKSFEIPEPSDKIVDADKFRKFEKLCHYLNDYSELNKLTTLVDNLQKIGHNVLVKSAYPVIKASRQYLVQSSNFDKKASVLPILSFANKMFENVEKVKSNIKAVPSPPLQSVQNFIDTIKRGKMLRELAKNDEILKEHPFEDIVKAYNSLQRLSPRASKNPQITLSFLRQIVTHPEALAGFEASSYVDLEKKLLELELLERGKVPKIK